MEVSEYHQKSEVVLITFPDSTNNDTPRKMFLFFNLACVCVYVSVCLCEKFVTGNLTNKLTDWNENFGY